jgi:hypothetical protein
MTQIKPYYLVEIFIAANFYYDFVNYLFEKIVILIG